MPQEFSCGIIPLRKRGRGWQVLLVQHGSAGYWGFPKGHREPGESDQETAARELFEETHLEVEQFLSETAIEIRYFFKLKSMTIDKHVLLFPALVKGDLEIQQEELAAATWFPLSKAEGQITYETDKSAFRHVVGTLYR